jgi:hypothetical protein
MIFVPSTFPFHFVNNVNFMFRIVFWDVLPCKIIVDNHFTRQYIPEYNSEHHTRCRENLKSHKCILDLRFV